MGVGERILYRNLPSIRWVVETKFSQPEEFGARLIRAVSRRGLTIKIILHILSFNIYQMMGDGI